MRSALKYKWTFFLGLSFLFFNTVLVLASDKDDEDSPEVTARVARISFIQGNAQIKRAGSTDWETASLNVPLVEGDEIATEKDSNTDVQFDSQNILHLAENSFLKIVTLRDEGVAVSISEGKLSLRVFSFDKDKTYFEIDAPQTTISVQNAGLYRIDAGAKDQTEIRVTATEGAEARIYSADADFILHNGKSAKVLISGDRIGDHETAEAAQFADDWDTWVKERDTELAKLINDADYDKYYDRDIYGAEDLNSYGQWHDSTDYGWVWQPYDSSLSSYQGWTPYQYGRWSWIAPYGWTWVNDEPWGWAPYHYGRWVYDNNHWGWTPYPYEHSRRSWWRPAIVVIGNTGGNISWYPTPYNKSYHDFNRHDREKYLDKRNFNNNNRNVGANLPSWISKRDGAKHDHRDFNKLPPNAIVSVKTDGFGRRRDKATSLSNQAGGQSLAQNPDKIKGSPKLPGYWERRENSNRPQRIQEPTAVRTGASNRQPGVELEKQIENRRNQDRRSRDNSNGRSNNAQNQNSRTESQTQNQQNSADKSDRQRLKIGGSETRKDSSTERKNENHQRGNSDNGNSVSTPRKDNSNGNNQNNRSRNDDNRKNDQPRQSNDQTRSQPRQEQPRQERRSEEPRSEPRREQPRQEQPRQEPRREQPRQEQPRQEQRHDSPRQESPKSEPKENKPSTAETKKDTNE